MSATIRVEVCEADIAAGQRGCGSSCPVALAILLATLGRKAMVDQVVISWAGPPTEQWVDVRCPPEAAVFIEAFDAGRPVTPFAFDVPDPRAPR